MALIRCKDCGNEISKKADKCPKCGNPNVNAWTRQRNSTPAILVIMAAAGLFYFFAGSDDKKPQETPQSGQQQAASIENKPEIATQQQIDDAQTFCLATDKILKSNESAFSQFQTSVMSASKSGNAELLANGVKAYFVRSGELSEDASGVSVPDSSSTEARTAMNAVVASLVSMANIGITNSLATRDLITGDASIERSVEVAQEIDKSRKDAAIRYAVGMKNVFESYGFVAQDLQDQTMCLKKDAKPKLTN